MSEYSVLEVIEMAVQVEKMGNEFYTELAGKFKDDKDLHELFVTLAAREQVHEKTFIGLKETLGGEEPEGWEEVSNYLRAVVESAFFLGRDKAVAHMENIQNHMAAVGFALAFEKETLLFFYGIRDAVREKAAVDKIISEEQSHIIWLDKFKKK